MADNNVHFESGLKTILSYMKEMRGQNNGEHLTDKDLAKLAASIWEWADALPAGERQFRIVSGDGTLPLLEIAGPDVPFLVDSVLAECLSQHADVRALFHPIVARDADASSIREQLSVIQVHLGPLSDAEQKRLLDGIAKTLDDLQQVITDFPEMLARMRQERKLLAGAAHLGEYDRAEALAFLDWLVGDHFVFLGARTYRFEIDDEGNFSREEPMMVEGANLGILRDGDRNVLSRGDEPTMLTGAVGEFLQMPEPLIVAKSSMISRVHRRVRADYIGVKHYDDRGRVIGEFPCLALSRAGTRPKPMQTFLKHGRATNCFKRMPKHLRPS